jgi:cell division protein FtsQ
LVVAVLAAAGAWVLLGTSLLAVRTVEVTGSTIVSADQVRAAADVTLGTPLARIDTGAVGQRVKALAPVADVDVRRSWPSTLVIAVTERRPVAAVPVAAGFEVLDGSGVVFETVTAAPAGAVLLTVRRPGPTDPDTTAGLTVISSLTPQLRAVVRQVDVASSDGIELELIDGRVIVWGDAQRSAKKAQIATLLLGRAHERLDVSAPDQVVAS